MALRGQSHTRRRGRSASFSLAGLALLVVAALSPGELHSQYSVDPVLMRFTVDTVVQASSARIRNDGDEPLQVRLYLSDFERDEEGHHSFLVAGKTDRSCADVLSVAPDAITVPPGEERDITIFFEPWSGSHTCWSVVFAETLARVATGFRVKQRIGVKVFGLESGGSVDGDIASAEVEVGPEGRELRFGFANSGSWPVQPSGTVEIRDYDGRTYGTTEVRRFTVLPGRTRVIRVPIEAPLEPGRYLAIPILDYGSDYLVGAQAAFSVP